MSKADGWDKRDAFEWRKTGPLYKAGIDKVIGGVVPYYWDVYPLPRSEHISDDGRYRAFKRGSAKTLAEAKRGADLAIKEIESK